jgi:UDP-N-acetylmuramate--alanine ligase
MTSAPTPSSTPEAPLELSTPQRLHVVGVGGPGMSAIAIALAEMGHSVSGSDLREQPVLDRVRAAGVHVVVGHRRDIVHGCAAITASSAIPDRNIELDEARATGVAVLSRAGMLASICAMAKSLGVAGTHGKTSTSSMLMLILADAGARPSFVIGGDVADMGTGAQWTGGDWLVVEADESDGTHVQLPLAGGIVTNVDVDHLDHFASFAAIVDSFEQFISQIQGPRVVCADDPELSRLAAQHSCITYGTSAGAEYSIGEVRAADGRQRFTISHRREPLVELTLPLRGMHNVRNATAAAALAHSIGIGPEAIRRALDRFGGVARRFDVRAVDAGATLVDDYAHLPAEISAVLTAARTGGDEWSRLIAVFQPNRYNRMSLISDDYGSAFEQADVVVLTDIYASGTQPIPGVTGKLVVNAVAEQDPQRRVVWLPQRRDVVDFVARELREGDVCISMGCGDIATFPDEVVHRRRQLRGDHG